MNKVHSSILLTSLLLPMMLVGCGSNQDPSLCVDGTNNHSYVFYDKEEFDEEEGHEAYYECSKCNKLFDQNKKYETSVPKLPPKRKIFIPNKLVNVNFDVIDVNVKRYLSLTKESEQAAFLYNYQNYVNAETSGVNISWTRNGCGNSLVLEIAKDDQFVNLERSIANLKDNSIIVYNLPTGRHYYRLKDSSGNYSLVDSFTISNPLSTIKRETNENVKNMRDLAGYSTLTQDKLKYGMLYRSALPTQNDLRLFYSELHIKTEMDLRKTDEIGSFEGVGKGLINYVHPVSENAQYWPQYDEIFKNQYETYTKAYFQNVFTVLADSTSYPLVFHCTHGADRTGTLAYIISGLAGVPISELTKDYELTSFYYSARWRSNIIKNGENYSFDPSGIYKENLEFNLFHSEMMNKYGSNKSLQEAILSFLTSYCEVNSNLIKSTLGNILEGTSYMSLFN